MQRTVVVPSLAVGVLPMSLPWQKEPTSGPASALAGAAAAIAPTNATAAIVTILIAAYLSQLRSGNRTNPSAATMAALANFFRIKPAYFTDDEYYEKLDDPFPV